MTKKPACWEESNSSCQKRGLLRKLRVMHIVYTDTWHLAFHAQMQTV